MDPNVATLFTAVLAPVVTLSAGVLAWNMQRRWEFRRDACLKALEVVDASASHAFSKPDGLVHHRQKVYISDARRVFAQLQVSCKPSTVDAFADALGLQLVQESGEVSEISGGMTGAAIAEFRKQVRRELFRFHTSEIKSPYVLLATIPGAAHEVEA